ncbi:MAG TPA: hypothetical protein VM778_03495, partial [Gemmatimonadota bacterium]|nr:hypothetical protein [Gemmatimonadota bacterium]
LNDQWSFNLGQRYDEEEGASGEDNPFSDIVGGSILRDRLWLWGSWGKPEEKDDPPAAAPALADAFQTGLRVGYQGTPDQSLNLGGLNPGFLDGGLSLDGQNYGTRLRIQANGAQRGPGGSIPDLAEASPLLLFESLGGSTGEVVRAHLLHDGAGPISVEGFAVLEPVETTSGLRERFDEALQGAAAKVTATVEAYCLDKAKIPLSQGELFRLAPRAVQEAYAHVGGILDAAERLRDAGGLTPDTNPASYFHSIRQWAVWTRAEGYDPQGFVEAFVEHTRKNVEEGGQRWTDEIEQIVRRSAEGRWRDVESVLEAAAAASR